MAKKVWNWLAPSIVVIIIILAILIPLSMKPAEEEVIKIKIGAVFELTGPMAGLCEQFLKWSSSCG